MPQIESSEHGQMVTSVDILAPEYVVSPHCSGAPPSSGQDFKTSLLPHKWSMVIATWINMVKWIQCTVVYMHIYGKSTQIDLLRTPAKGNHKERRRARLRNQHQQTTILETLWSYMLTPYKYLATAWIVLTIGIITLLLSLLPGMEKVWALLQWVCHNVHNLWGLWDWWHQQI